MMSLFDDEQIVFRRAPRILRAFPVTSNIQSRATVVFRSPDPPRFTMDSIMLRPGYNAPLKMTDRDKRIHSLRAQRSVMY